MRFIGFLGLIYALALFFWLRYIWHRSLRTADKRKQFVESLQKITPYIPIGLHTVFLFCYAVFQFRPVYIRMSALFARYVLKTEGKDTPDFYPLQLIFTVSLLITFYYFLLRLINAVREKTIAFTLHVLLFTAGLYSLKILVLNIRWSAGLADEASVPVTYANSYLWILTLLFTFFVSLVGGESIRTDSWFKYIALTCRLLWLYFFAALLFSLPRIFYALL